MLTRCDAHPNLVQMAQHAAGTVVNPVSARLLSSCPYTPDSSPECSRSTHSGPIYRTQAHAGMNGVADNAPGSVVEVPAESAIRLIPGRLWNLSGIKNWAMASKLSFAGSNHGCRRIHYGSVQVRTYLNGPRSTKLPRFCVPRPYCRYDLTSPIMYFCGQFWTE